MKVVELVTTARDAITVKRVFADPYEKDGVTVIPAAIWPVAAEAAAATMTRVRRVRAGASG